MSPARQQHITTYDYIVIGAGTAGCVLAARLSGQPDIQVCLIEAGASEQHPYINIPAAVGAAIMSERFGWGLVSTPQPALGQRQIPLPRGRVLGGTGSINGMAYYRGNARDFDDWAAQGNKGWSYAELLPYFLRSEHNPDYPHSPYHHQGGPMSVSFMQRTNRLCEAFNAGMQALGFPHCQDFNTAEPEGYGYRQGTISRGRRVSTASAYLRPVLDRPNLHVMTTTQARRILVENGRANAVEVQTQSTRLTLAARREIILSAGAFHSPHILLHSGIGDRKQLDNAGIKPVHHLPGVGKHLADHPATYVAMDMRDSTSYGLSWKASLRNIYNGFEYLLARRGPLSSNLFETNAYIRSMPGLDRPDMQVVFQPARRNTRAFPLPLGHGFAISLVCLYPESRGTVSISSSDPLSAPLIDPALGSAQTDIDTLVRGLKLARRICAQDGFRAYQAHERLPGATISSDAALQAYVRDTLATVHHPGGTCRMGSGADAVVDHELKVHGIEGLRVADASIYPRLVGGNTNASVVAIAEKAADMILSLPAPAALSELR
ncbi:MAG: GMC family oxidoreductase N-terminal domain-containing protein [Pseudomonadales bacterium]|nr:GMC family oxidoreductase N-terminal domain-containing protein [Pseudomonadales bacterium]